MVRLSTINLSLHESAYHTTSIGNSLYSGSPIDSYNGKVDLVITNPPFGASFTHIEVAKQCAENCQFFSQPMKLRGPIDSELLFVDRNLALLKDGGILAIVLPDSVISAKGTPSLLRHYLKHFVTVRAVVELPSVTFAQAGTRTKTSVILVKKVPANLSENRVMMANCRSLGFEVKSRKGVLVKIEEGKNELPELNSLFRKFLVAESTSVSMNAEVRPVLQELLRDVWTPGHYLGDSSDDNVSSILSDLVSFVGDGRRARKHEQGDTYISVLHIIGDGVLDLKASCSYAPKTPGIPVSPGEILLSRINPRIPRVLVVPPIKGSILCSSEFEIMEAKPVLIRI